MTSQTPPTTLGVLEQALFASAPRVTIGRFEVIRQLGRGGMGVVYLARDPQLKRDVAIKVHRGSDGSSGAPRLRREAESLAQLRHRNVVTVFEVGGTDTDDVFLVMEHLPGPTVRRWIERDAPDVPAILDVFARCARGLSAAHDRGIIHRDFKPDNVVIDSDGEPHIVDFGLARIEDAGIVTADGGSTAEADIEKLVTRGGNTPGTPRYMAPELWDGEPSSPASDQFAWAVALYECVAGTPPFAARQFTPPARPRGLSRRAWRVLRRALDLHPVRRWPSMNVLERALAGAGRPTAARRIATWAAAATLATGGVAAVVLTIDMLPPRTSAAPGPAAASAQRDIEVRPCVIGTDLLATSGYWATSSPLAFQDDDGLHLRLPAGPRNGVKAELLDFPVSFEDRAVEFEVAQLHAPDTTNELFLNLENAEREAFSILVWSGSWVFPMAPNTHGLAMEIDRRRHHFFRISVQDQVTLPDLVTFEFSSDGATWVPIARVEGSLSDARVSVAVKSAKPISTDAEILVRSARCTGLQPVAPMDPERDRARTELDED